ncbi:hypothetical protein NLI96_g4548 [Meripilus lineatus]|uniref:F-box domain-containing protein n=1 Tax=Meripilus lineatus TaxID=2056292 RepID=A0AAD5V4R7_9APHY|nr:hypothetical protein NLI96_g4548 [Physisporinus lineatus]
MSQSMDIPPKEDQKLFINDLPPELLSHIFVIGAEDAYDDDEDDEDDITSSASSESNRGAPEGSSGSSSSGGSYFFSNFLLGGVAGDSENKSTEGESRGRKQRVKDDDSTSSSNSRPCSCLGHAPSDSDSDSDSSDYPPFELLITRICHKWRAIAIDTPMLWTNIDFSNGTPPFEKQREYLRRSKASPISLHIDCTYRQDEDSEEDDEPDEDALEDRNEAVYGRSRYNSPKMLMLKTIMEMILPHLFHWRTFELMVSKYKLMQYTLSCLSSPSPSLITSNSNSSSSSNARPISDPYPYTSPSQPSLLLSCAAPLLEVLELYHYDEPDDHELFHPSKWKDQDFVIFGNNCPRLAHVALWGVHLNWRNTKFLSGLHELELTYHSTDVWLPYRDFARILRESPRLGSLTLRQSGPAGERQDWIDSMVSAVKEGDFNNENVSSLPPGTVHTNSGVQVLSSSALITVTLPVLRTLNLGYLPPTYVTDLCKNLVMPVLQNLYVDFEEDDFEPFLKQVSTPHPVSGKILLAGIERLKVSGLTCLAPVVRQAYGVMDKVRWLEVNMDYVDFAWYQLLLEERPPPESAAGQVPQAGPTGTTAPHPHPPKATAAATTTTTTTTTSAGASSSTSTSTTTTTGVTQPQPQPIRAYLPKLEKLRTTSLDGMALRELVVRRMELKCPLKELYANEEDDVCDEDQEWLDKQLQKFDYFSDSDVESDMDSTTDEEEEEEGGTVYDVTDEEDDEWEDVDDDEEQDEEM